MKLQVIIYKSFVDLFENDDKSFLINFFKSARDYLVVLLILVILFTI